jgi:iron(III) transport system substrate-binding protein
MKTIGCARRLSCALGCAFGGGAWAQKTQLTVYTALETDQIKAYENGFTKSNPNIELKWVRDSTGVITAKLLAEKANPQADVVMGSPRRASRCSTARHADAATRRSTSTRS